MWSTIVCLIRCTSSIVAGRAAAVLCASLLAACGGEESPGTSATGDPPPDAGPPTGCAAGERPLDDGSCQNAGVRPDACADGFEADDDGGCTAILPASPCGEGTMAVPGDTECREVAPCGDAPWGDIPVDGTTRYVDGAYAGGDSDGTSRRPWTTILDALVAAAPDDLIAIAAGSYQEDVLLVSKPVRLWGRCPSMVEIGRASCRERV